jgi:hypothetical protein
MGKPRRTTTRVKRRKRPGPSNVHATARNNSNRISALQLEVESTTALCRRQSEELAVQFKRIAQLQAEIDELRKLVRTGG